MEMGLQQSNHWQTYSWTRVDASHKDNSFFIWLYWRDQTNSQINDVRVNALHLNRNKLFSFIHEKLVHLQNSKSNWTKQLSWIMHFENELLFLVLIKMFTWRFTCFCNLKTQERWWNAFIAFNFKGEIRLFDKSSCCCWVILFADSLFSELHQNTHRNSSVTIFSE